jgi:tetratricopeptide (TPR) repeat protein
VLRLAPVPAPLALIPPFEAYREDVERLAGRSPIGAADDAWLVAAHTLARAAALPVGDRAALLAAGGDAVRAVVAEALAVRVDEPGERLLRTAGAAGDALSELARLLAEPEVAAESFGAPVAALQQLVAEQEQAGAFRLAFTTLGMLRLAASPALDARSTGLLLAQQGRAARQLGALETARELYREAVRTARRADVPEVATRALLGLGVLANMRGNYPDARRWFRRAVAAARRCGSRELQHAAHQGLFVAAIAAHDVETALAHGWAAVRRTAPDMPNERAEALANLADVACLAGDHRAALGAGLSVLELTDLARIRLPVLATALRAAAALGELRLVAHLISDAERTIARSGQPYENARVLNAIAEVLVARDDDRAAGYATRAGELARAGGFHEVLLHADEALEHAGRKRHVGVDGVRQGIATGDVATEPRTARARAVLRTMEALPGARRYALRLAR